MDLYDVGVVEWAILTLAIRLTASEMKAASRSAPCSVETCEFVVDDMSITVAKKPHTDY